MKRRDFFEDGLATGAAVAASVSFPNIAHSAPAKPVKERMFLQTQGFGSTDAELMFLQRCAVLHKTGRFSFIEGKGWDIDDMNREIDRHAKFGITLEMSMLPISNILSEGEKNPERDREIDIVCDMIRTAAKAGITSLQWVPTILPVDSTGREAGRGGYYYRAFRLDSMPKEEQMKLTKMGRVTADMFWERITYLLDRMIPVANEYRMRLGSSQMDPPVPDGYKGVDKVLNDFEGMKRFIEIQRSPYNGWNFCIGSIAEMCKNPATEVFPFIKYFGDKKTIFLVHYRNIKGGRYSFRETLPDEGDVDMWRVIKALKDVGYTYGVDPDHVPSCPDDPACRLQGYAYCFGYIKAMIQAVYGES
jgi:mannonate dehydratase